MTAPLDTVNDIRSMEAAGRSRSEIARTLHLSRNTGAKYADMEDMSLAALLPAEKTGPLSRATSDDRTHPRGRPSDPRSSATEPDVYMKMATISKK